MAVYLCTDDMSFSGSKRRGGRCAAVRLLLFWHSYHARRKAAPPSSAGRRHSMGNVSSVLDGQAHAQQRIGVESQYLPGPHDATSPAATSTGQRPTRPGVSSDEATAAAQDKCQLVMDDKTATRLKPTTASVSGRQQEQGTATACRMTPLSTTEQQHAAERQASQQQRQQLHAGGPPQLAASSTLVSQRWPATAQQHLSAQEHGASGGSSSAAAEGVNGHAAWQATACAVQPPTPSLSGMSGAPGANSMVQIAAAKVAAGAPATPASSTTELPATGKLANPSAAASAATAAPAAALAPLGTAASDECAAPAEPLVAVELCTSPRLLLVDGFLDEATCHQLIRMADPMMVRSRVATGLETPSRTSSSCFFIKEAAKHPLVQDLEDKIMELFTDPAIMQERPALERVEALQVVRYHVGEFYYEHYDNKAGGKPTRDATIIIYLCETEDGGATHFPKANLQPRYVRCNGDGSTPEPLPPNVKADSWGQGVCIGPLLGRALVFWSCHANGTEDIDSLDASLAVRKGMKYIATRWLRRAGEAAADTTIKPAERAELQPGR